ncbi:hypothetical protein K435DRAFT_937938 [Dendrothele bispora CBS 962.96]|uniref:CNH domain-containing protein n=1 Tax=Dendrothele bispora (strain CBS 962.96) TaxID=1314807 RepID=A0A4S8KUF8_DENBC|nr:hypothetical protein K435DRAFT_697661 [Dendrothele bispora CBS 962.96]THU99668.1 hypothetical protein K435DRAFT_937938 [Dendrothele bispora CBS 962.96]
MLEWDATANSVAFRDPYILLFDTRFIEVRQIQTGRLIQIIPGENFNCLWDGSGVETPRDKSKSQDVAIHGVMTVKDPVSNVIVQNVFELVHKKSM